MKDAIVIIEPRRGITAEEVMDFLRQEFQRAGQCDGNPLINAAIGILSR